MMVFISKFNLTCTPRTQSPRHRDMLRRVCLSETLSSWHSSLRHLTLRQAAHLRSGRWALLGR
eukprot:1180836-Prorocentrum_minimum.AAC.1